MGLFSPIPLMVCHLESFTLTWTRSWLAQAVHFLFSTLAFESDLLKPLGHTLLDGQQTATSSSAENQGCKQLQSWFKYTISCISKHVYKHLWYQLNSETRWFLIEFSINATALESSPPLQLTNMANAPNYSGATQESYYILQFWCWCITHYKQTQLLIWTLQAASSFYRTFLKLDLFPSPGIKGGNF